MIIIIPGILGVWFLYQILVQNKQVLRPNLIKKFGEQKSRNFGIALAIFLIIGSIVLHVFAFVTGNY
jgi:hypothetical protein